MSYCSLSTVSSLHLAVGTPTQEENFVSMFQMFFLRRLSENLSHLLGL